ncbi:hypothetical protein LSH36_478g02020 [Paralvinella palmiformis]|uniref:Uncharacterized protein n=1 Tax=Paralvinella palmiformis TaxID=53620 RepID=A0AAD9MYZ0_9ANNE|nr:hypothetical protein LSH36_478g02020 [Paralvinella palmiformis]
MKLQSDIRLEASLSLIALFIIKGRISPFAIILVREILRFLFDPVISSSYLLMQLSQERLERRIDELNKQLLVEKHSSRRDKLTLARLQQEMSRQKSERQLVRVPRGTESGNKIGMTVYCLDVSSERPHSAVVHVSLSIDFCDTAATARVRCLPLLWDYSCWSRIGTGVWNKGQLARDPTG